MKKWLLILKSKETKYYINNNGYVYDNESKNSIKLYVLKKKTMELLKELCIACSESN